MLNNFSEVVADSVESPTGRNLEIAVENNCAVGLVYSVQFMLTPSTEKFYESHYGMDL